RRARTPPAYGSLTDLQRTANERDSARTDTREMRHGFEGPFIIISSRRIRFQIPRGSHHKHNRYFYFGKRSLKPRGQSSRGHREQDAVDALGEQQLQVMLLFLPLIVAVA